MNPFTKTYWIRFRDGLALVLPLAVVGAAAALFFGLPALREGLAGRLFEDLKLEYPVYVDIDQQDSLFVIDKNSRRIVSISADGRERWVLEGGKRVGGFYETYRLAAAPDGGVVAYNFIRDASDDSFEAEELVRFGPDGGFLGVLARLEYPRELRGEEQEHLGSLRVKDGFLYYSYTTAGRIELLKRSLVPGAESSNPADHERVFSAPQTLDMVASAAHLPQGIIAADRAGGLAVLNPDGSVSKPGFVLSDAGNVLEKPWDLKVGPGGEVYILDNYLGSVFRVASLDAISIDLLFSEQNVLAKGRQRPSFEGIAISPQGTLGVVDKFNHSVFLVGADGVTHIVSGGTKSVGEIYANLAWIAVDMLALFAVLWSLVGLGRRQFADRTSLVVKQILLFLPLVIVSVSVGSLAIYRLLDGNFQKELRAKLVLVADLGSRLIDGGLVASIQKASDWDGPAHRALGQQFSSILNNNNDEWNKDLRTVIYKFQGDKFYFVKNTSSYYGVMFPYGGAQPEHFAAARGGSLESALYSDEYGTYIAGIAPVRDSKGTVTGILEVYHNYNTVTENTSLFLVQLFQGILIVVLAVLLLLIIADVLMFLSLGYLRRASNKLMDGELGLTVHSRRRDEIGDLARDFNTMSFRLREHFDRLAEVRDANSRFVPKPFLHLLGKDSLKTVNSGDQSRQRLTVFFADIRSFTTLSEGMTPKENFDFVNEYFSVMGPQIRAHNGFIDRYLGDAMLALFPGSPSDAVEAGLAMRSALQTFNNQRVAEGKAAVQFGVGIHVEDLILGVVGETNRLSVTVISDAVDLVNRLEAATKKHHVGMVITKPVWEALPVKLQREAVPLGHFEEDSHSEEIFGL